MHLEFKRGLRVLACSALPIFAAPATGQTTGASTFAALQTRALAATCAACHGTDGRAVQGGAIVALAGYPDDRLVARMRAYRDGTLPATVMQQIARGYDESQVRALAAYFAAQPGSPR